MATAFFLTACQDKEAGKLDNRALAFWDLKIKGDYKSAYELLSPGWRSNESLGSFQSRMAQSKVKWISANIKNKTCSQKNVCKIGMIIEYEYQFAAAFSKKMKISTKLEENWIMKDNVWYLVPNEHKLK